MEINSQLTQKEKVVVTGIGMVTSVGHDSIMAPASIRAGISSFREITDFVTNTGARAVGSFVDGVTDERSGSDRLLSMAIPAAQEALYMAEEFYEDLDLAAGCLFLSMCPPERPTYEDFDKEDVRDFLELTQTKGIESIEIIKEGNSGGIMALSKAMIHLSQKKAKVCIVGGIDSLVEYPSLAWLEEKGRLRTDDRPRGFIPGEAAAFMVLELESTAIKRGVPLLCEICSLGYVVEDVNIFSDKPFIGVGLAESINNSLTRKQMEIEKINGIICDLNGEYYRFKEWGLTQTRIFKNSSSLPELWHPAECFGDVGSASAIVHSVIAIAGINREYFNGPNLLIWTSSDTGGRGSVLLTASNKAKDLGKNGTRIY